MPLKRIFVRFTFILMTCSSFGLAQRSEPASTSAVGGQIVVSEGGLKRPVPVLLDHSGAKSDRRTFTDLHGNFEFRNVPEGSYNIRVGLEGFENVNYPVDVPGTPYVFIFLHGSTVSALRPHAVGGNQIVDIRQLTANIAKQALKEYEKACEKLRTTTRNAPSSGWETLPSSPRTSTMRIWVLRRSTEKPIGWMLPNKSLLAHPP